MGGCSEDVEGPPQEHPEGPPNRGSLTSLPVDILGLISITRAVIVSVAFEAGFLGLALSRVYKNSSMKTSRHSLFGPKPRNLAGSLILSWFWQPWPCYKTGSRAYSPAALVNSLVREQFALPLCSVFQYNFCS